MRVFITGTDTDVGKTLISSWLCLHTGYGYFKPIQTGSLLGSDGEQVAQLSGVHTYPECFVYKDPVSPHLAAAREGEEIALRDLTLPTQDRLIIEGAGGVLVPINKHALMVDLMKQWDVPVVLVARSSLGTINHTLLSLEALRQRHVPILGVILNGPLDCDNARAIEHYGNVRILASMLPLSTVCKATLQSIPLSPDLKRIFHHDNAHDDA